MCDSYQIQKYNQIFRNSLKISPRELIMVRDRKISSENKEPGFPNIPKDYLLDFWF